jgi:uncharacterized membrane protein YphA (DoxX/SURF4 family)
MMNWLTNKYFIFVVRWVIGLVFIYAAIDKIVHPDQFARIIHNYHIAPGNLVNIGALFMPTLEILAGLMLITGFWEKSATVVVTGLLLAFVIALSTALVRGVNIECGCFSTTSKAKGPVIDLIIRDLLMLIGCALILVAKKSFLSYDGWRRRALS